MGVKTQKPIDPRKALEQVVDALYPATTWTASPAVMRRAIEKAERVLDRYYRSIANGEAADAPR